MIKALVPLAEGVEEMEAVIVVDTLRRAGWIVTTAAITPQPITASRGVRLLADTDWAAITPADYDVLVLPGGAGGTRHMIQSPAVQTAIRDFHAQAKFIAAICAAPLVLQAAGILAGKQVTCHPGVAGDLTATARSPNRVVVDGNLITSQGPGTAFEFALAILRHVSGPAAVETVTPGLILP
ncbi:MAG: DJ-1/PfpI family protein [Verrucomicrobia bacterium]|nr:DJ-1/PfpI family protein [Verrucomicrobiota bacterium]